MATNIYLDYWREMVSSFDEFVGDTVNCTFYVFTDRPETAEKYSHSLKNSSRVVPVRIDNLGWPDASLLRFELIESHMDQANEDVLMHLDADMLLHDGFDSEFDSSQWIGGIFLVAHPGFYQEYLRKQSTKIPQGKIKHFVAQLLKGKAPIMPLGSWETNPKSVAHVPEVDRRVYVCGATWGGAAKPFRQLIGHLAGQTRLDRSNGVLAVWHDESHLNKWASAHTYSLLSSSYCHAEPFSKYMGLKRIIEAVDKGARSTR